MKTDVNVKFYTLSTFPTETREGSFLHLNTESGNHKVGLYFCDSTGWSYLTNIPEDKSSDINSAKVFGNYVYFFNEEEPPEDEPEEGSYRFRVDMTKIMPDAGSGISVDSNKVSVSLADNSCDVDDKKPNESSPTVLFIDTDSKLSIADTWNCGEYDSNIQRHVQNLKTNNLGYCRIHKTDVPDGETVTQVSAIPTTVTTSSAKYIQVTTNNWYYCLCGKKPAASSLKYGEISVSYAAGYERLYIKNSSDSIVEFEPSDHRKNIVVNATFKNEELEPDENAICYWYIAYEDITDAGISTSSAAVFVRENKTGKQTVPDVVFDDENKKLIISIYSKENISAELYTAIVMGSNYNN